MVSLEVPCFEKVSQEVPLLIAGARGDVVFFNLPYASPKREKKTASWQFVAEELGSLTILNRRSPCSGRCMRFAVWSLWFRGSVVAFLSWSLFMLLLVVVVVAAAVAVAVVVLCCCCRRRCCRPPRRRRCCCWCFGDGGKMSINTFFIHGLARELLVSCWYLLDGSLQCWPFTVRLLWV